MRIEKTRSTGVTRSGGRTGDAGDSAAFRNALGGSTAAASATNVGASVGVNSVAALMALQSAEDPLEKRRRVERRGRQLLDGLDRLKLDLLEGGDPRATLERLKAVLESERENSGELELESLIDQIELRVEVELAKLESNHSVSGF